MLQPKWVLELKKKASIKKVNVMLTGVILSVIAAIIGWGYEIVWGLEEWAVETGLIAGGITLGVCWLFGGICALLCVKVRVRHYNGNIICLYSGYFKEWLYIDGELFDEGVGIASLELYGQLPTGEEVVVKTDCWGDIKFYIGTTTNNQSINL